MRILYWTKSDISSFLTEVWTSPSFVSIWKVECSLKTVKWRQNLVESDLLEAREYIHKLCTEIIDLKMLTWTPDQALRESKTLDEYLLSYLVVAPINTFRTKIWQFLYVDVNKINYTDKIKYFVLKVWDPSKWRVFIWSRDLMITLLDAIKRSEETNLWEKEERNIKKRNQDKDSFQSFDDKLDSLTVENPNFQLIAELHDSIQWHINNMTIELSNSREKIMWWIHNSITDIQSRVDWIYNRQANYTEKVELSKSFFKRAWNNVKRIPWVWALVKVVGGRWASNYDKWDYIESWKVVYWTNMRYIEKSYSMCINIVNNQLQEVEEKSLVYFEWTKKAEKLLNYLESLKNQDWLDVVIQNLKTVSLVWPTHEANVKWLRSSCEELTSQLTIVVERVRALKNEEGGNVY